MVVSPGWVERSEQLDLVAGLERHDGLLEFGGHAGTALAGFLVFAALDDDIDAGHGDLEGLLDGLADGALCGGGMDQLEGAVELMMRCGRSVDTLLLS